MIRRSVLLAATLVVALVASACSGGNATDEASLPGVPPTPTPDVLSFPMPTAVGEREIVSSAADEDPVFEGELADFCTAWTQLNRAAARYIPNHIVRGADEITAAVEAVRPVVPPQAPQFVQEQFASYAYQGVAGTLARDMQGAELDEFLEEVGDRYFAESLRRPANSDDAKWTNKNCPGSRAARRTDVPPELLQVERLDVGVPEGVEPVSFDEMGVSFEANREFFTIAADPPGDYSLGRLYVHHVDEDSVLTTLLSIAGTREADRDEPYTYGLCGLGSSEEMSERQERAIYLEPTGNGTVIVIGYRPPRSDLDPAVFQLSLVGDDDRAPKNLEDAGNCPVDYAIWDDATQTRYVATAEFLHPRSDGSPSRIRGAKSQRGFASIQELLEIPGAVHALHAMRTMEFDFLTSSE